MKIRTQLPTVIVSAALAASVSAATVSFRPSVPATTDVDWTEQSISPVEVQKFFVSDTGDNLSLKLVLTAGGISDKMRYDGGFTGNANYGWNPNGGSGVQEYRWTDGEEVDWTVTILDRDNGDADVTSSYDVLLTSLQSTNRAEVPDDATMILTNGNGDTRNIQALAGTGVKDNDFTGFDAKSMNFQMTNHPDTGTTHYFRLDDVTFEVTKVPEPSSAALLGLGGLAFIMRRRK